MAKSKAGPGRAYHRTRNHNNNTVNKKYMQNGLYVHSSPPKALNSDNGPASAKIREYIRAADVEALEEVILQGQGAKLVNQHAIDHRVRSFLKTVPSYMSKIDLVHDSVEKGNLRELKALLDRRKLARSKDAQGVGLLHKAVVHGHRDIVDYLISDYPETLQVTDNDGRLPLHYCAASRLPDEMYTTLCEAVEDTQVQDKKGKTAADYMSHPEEIRHVTRRSNSNKGSGGSKGKRRTPPKRNSPANKIRTPPKREGMNITGANIRIWIHDQDLPRLEQIVWEGEGHRLLQETSNHAKVRQFLNLVPRMMTKIKEVHQAALNGDMETLDAKVEQPEILTAKDQNGLNPLHKAAALGNLDVVEWIVQKNQSTVFAQDRKGRTPLFYGGLAKDGGEVYNLLLRSGSDASHSDKYRKTAEHYRYKPQELDLSVVHDRITAPRAGGSTLDIPTGHSRAPSNQNSRTPSRNNGRSRNPSRNPSRKNSMSDLRKARSRRNSNKSTNGYKDLKDVTDTDIEKFIRDADVDSLECVVLSGRGSDLQGRSSWNEQVRRFLKKVPGYMEKITSLHEAAGKGDIRTAKRLTKENERLAMARGRDGVVALHLAAGAGHGQLVRHLVSVYPDGVKVEDQNGRTPMHYAGLCHEKGGQEAYDVMRKEGGSETWEDQESIDQLHAAVEEGENRKVMSLLDTRKKALTRDPNHCNILHKAVLFNHTGLAEYLTRKYPELLDQEDLAGRTPLHYAGTLKDEGHLYHTLLNAGADDTRRDQSGHTPEDYFRDPDLMTDWDLRKELEEGLSNRVPSPTRAAAVESRGRPYTKGSEAFTSYYGGEEDGMDQMDPAELYRLEQEYETLRSTKSRSLMKKYLTPETFERLKHRVTIGGATLLDVIKSGLANPDSSIGLYAPDAESYTLFNELFDPVIDEYHGGFGPGDYHPGINFGTAGALGDLNEWGDYVVSTRVRCARSLEGYPFNPLMTNEQYYELEQDVERALDSLDGDLAGYYRPLSRLSPEEQDTLLQAHLLFKQGDRFLEAAGACRFWPDGRGIFLNSDNTLVVWVSEEDHMRIISMQNGGNLAQVYDRFVRAVTALGNRLPFSFSQRLGFLNFCPTNLGTAIRASVHIRLPHLGSDHRLLEDTADQFHLQVRGTSGEHSAAKDFVFDISNRRRLGLTEIEALQEMNDGVMEIIRLERQMEESSSRKGSSSSYH